MSTAYYLGEIATPRAGGTKTCWMSGGEGDQVDGMPSDDGQAAKVLVELLGVCI